MRSNQPMPLPDMRDPSPLTKEKVDAAIGHKTAGFYVLGALGDNKVMSVSYVGRSDDDLAAKLKRHAGNYATFAFATTASALHPIGKRGPDWACPVLGDVANAQSIDIVQRIGFDFCRGVLFGPAPPLSDLMLVPAFGFHRSHLERKPFRPSELNTRAVEESEALRSASRGDRHRASFDSPASRSAQDEGDD